MSCDRGEVRRESGSIFKIRPTPMTMQSTGGFRNPAGHGGVYKVDEHWHQSRVSEEENSIFLPCQGAGAAAHPSIFFPIGLAVAVSECRPLPRLRAGAFLKFGPP